MVGLFSIFHTVDIHWICIALHLPILQLELGPILAILKKAQNLGQFWVHMSNQTTEKFKYFYIHDLRKFHVNKSITNLSIWTYENTGFFYNTIIRLTRRLMPIIKSPWTWVLAQPIWNIPFDFFAFRIGSIDPMRYSICWHNFRSFLEIQC